MRPLESVDPQPTLSEVLDSVPQARRIFEALEIDPCCSGRVTLARGAAEAGADLDELAPFERALQEHIRIENRIFFPKAQARERAARNELASGRA